nr:retrovirus-related Pol polyprotein from transposon TNT 1-94 [Tanacetum cinerariifolium]
MAAYAFFIAEEEDTHEPITFQDVINSSDKDEWVRAIEEEMSSLMKNHTWELVDQPPGQKLISFKWLYKIKEGIESIQKPRYKARLVARRFTQQAGIDYNEVFSPVVRHTSIRVIISLTACEDYELEQLDVKTAFLHGNLEETIYIRQPPGFEERMGNKICLLKKSLYGLKQSPRQWYKRFDVYMINNGFSRNNYDSCVYFKEFAPGTGPARKILGMEIVRDRGSRTLKMSQSGYVQKIMNNYRVDNGKSVSMPLGAHIMVSLKDCLSNDWDVERMSKVSYANVVGSLMYLMVCTRPDIAYAISIMNRYLANPGKNHWEAVKWILKYLKGTADVGLVYARDQGKHVYVDGFVDADYAKDPDKGRSITGYVFMAEYMALTEHVKESIWLKELLIKLGVNLRSVVLNCDNQSSIHLSRNAMFHERTKHINVRYHFIRKIMESKEIKVAKICTKDNAAGAFTKVVPGELVARVLFRYDFWKSHRNTLRRCPPMAFRPLGVIIGTRLFLSDVVFRGVFRPSIVYSFYLPFPLHHMSSGSQTGGDVVVLKFDMHVYTSVLTFDEVKNLVPEYAILLDLHPCVPPSGLTMNRLPADKIGICNQYLELSGVREDRFFLIDCHAIPDAMSWRHHDSNMADPPPTDVRAENIFRLCENVIDLRLVHPAMLYAIGLTTLWKHLGHHPIFKDDEGTVATSMSEFLKFPMAEGVRVGKGAALAANEVVKYENERVLATKRKTQAVKDEAAGKRSAAEGTSRSTKKKKGAPLTFGLDESEGDDSAHTGFGTHHSASPLNTIIPDDVDPASDGDSFVLESIRCEEDDADHSLDNVEDGTEADSPLVNHPFRSQRSKHFDKDIHVHFGGLHCDEEDEQLTGMLLVLSLAGPPQRNPGGDGAGSFLSPC